MKWIIMHNRIIAVCLVCALGLGFISCTSSKDKTISFRSEWVYIEENAITEVTTKDYMTIITDGIRYKRIEKEIERGSLIMIYDGTQFGVKYIYNHDKFGSDENNSFSIMKMTLLEAKTIMFWIRHRGEKTEHGERIANQETILYQLGGARVEGEYTKQWWVDAKTGITLKFMDTTYSSQMKQIIARVIYECKQISYETIDGTNFLME